VYFDYFGNLQSSKELERYLANSIIEYNRAPYQRYNQNNYGLCLQFLRLIDKQIKGDIAPFNSFKNVVDVYADWQE